MENDKKYYKERLQRARKQRLVGLKNAFKTIDCFAECSLNPELYGYYEQVKIHLIKQYSSKND